MAKKKKTKVQQISKQTFTNNPFQSLTLPFNPDANEADSQNNKAEPSLKSDIALKQPATKELSDEEVLMAMMDSAKPIKNKKETVPAAKTEITHKAENVLLPAVSGGTSETFFEETNRN
ncbi:MAG: hypothetical protein JXR91_01300 [Deltaproteobacteria bacterium]|nr:hypothetical protein [Deltaproteobacteria bacterium]